MTPVRDWQPGSSRSVGELETARAQSPYSFGEKVRRVLWNYIGQTLMRFTFHDWYAVRNLILRTAGARIGPGVRVRNSVTIEQPWNLSIGENSSVGDRTILYCLGRITIGRNCSISQLAHLCAGTHDYTRPDMPLVKLPIVLHDEVWIAADVFVGPGVQIGAGSVVGARSSVIKDLPAWKVCVGNPARPVKDRVLRSGPAPDAADFPDPADTPPPMSPASSESEPR